MDIKQARKRMAGHRTNAEIEQKPKARCVQTSRNAITVPKYLPQVSGAEYRLTAKKLVALHIFSDLDYDMLARYFIARDAWQNAQNWANRAIMQGDAKEAGSWTKTGERLFRPVPELCGGARSERVGTLQPRDARAAEGRGGRGSAEPDAAGEGGAPEGVRFARGCDGQCNACSSFDLWR